MSLSDPALWSRIERYVFPAPTKAKRWQSEAGDFEALLVRNMSVEAKDAKRLLLEYRKFIYLKALDGGLLSPPADLDEVWHFHISSPNGEWEKFCSTVVGRPLEHRTSLSFVQAKAARAKVNGLYRQEFGMPPTDIWPNPIQYWRIVLASALIYIGITLFIGQIIVMLVLMMSTTDGLLGFEPPINWIQKDRITYTMVAACSITGLGMVIGHENGIARSSSGCG